MIDSDSGPLTFAEVLRHWREDAAFRGYFGGLLARAPFQAFRWETPSVSTATINQTFECVVLDSPELDCEPDFQSFVKYFTASARSRGVVEFQNLGKDAVLVVPCPIEPALNYAHLGAFLRSAPDPQQQALWTQVGQAMQGGIGPAPVWLSTAGAGVPWLHVRIDNRPKYYQYAPYRR
jgi:hypothetical protein